MNNFGQCSATRRFMMYLKWTKRILNAVIHWIRSKPITMEIQKFNSIKLGSGTSFVVVMDIVEWDSNSESKSFHKSTYLATKPALLLPHPTPTQLMEAVGPNHGVAMVIITMLSLAIEGRCLRYILRWWTIRRLIRQRDQLVIIIMVTVQLQSPEVNVVIGVLLMIWNFVWLWAVWQFFWLSTCRFFTLWVMLKF